MEACQAATAIRAGEADRRLEVQTRSGETSSLEASSLPDLDTSLLSTTTTNKIPRAFYIINMALCLLSKIPFWKSS